MAKLFSTLSLALAIGVGVLAPAAGVYTPVVSAAVMTAPALYADAMGKEQAVRKALDDSPSAPLAKAVRSAIATYDSLVRHYPTSSYCDDALWRASQLALDAAARLKDPSLNSLAARYVKRLAAEYPASKYARQIPDVQAKLASLPTGPAPSPASPAPTITPAKATTTANAPEPTSAAAAAAPPSPRQPRAATTAVATRSATAAATTAPAATLATTGTRGTTVATPAASEASTTGRPHATLLAVHRTVLPDVIRLTFDIDREVTFRQDRLSSPPRIFFDFAGTVSGRSLADRTVRFENDSDVVRQVRVGQPSSDSVRVVLDATGVSTCSASPLYAPYRLVVDCVRAAGVVAAVPAAGPGPVATARNTSAVPVGPAVPAAPVTTTATVAKSAAPTTPASTPTTATLATSASSSPAKAASAPSTLTVKTENRPATAPAAAIVAATASSASTPNAATVVAKPPEAKPRPLTPATFARKNPEPAIAAPPVAAPPPAPLTARALAPPMATPALLYAHRLPASAIGGLVAGTPRIPATVFAELTTAALAPVPSATLAVNSAPAVPESLPVVKPPALPAPPAAKPGGSGMSMARQLGLTVSRVVIDPGHGGHDPGAKGAGTTEAALVLDIALRLEKMLQDEGVEVILTRRTDEFIALEERTAMANRQAADLFLSIHANASTIAQATGVETYYLNFADSASAAAVAARENAASGKPMNALPEVVKAIAMNSKQAESRDLATQVQRALVQKLKPANQGLRDLGVKQAPFVVLIGASMPSVLAEVAFITNEQEGRLLKGTNYRQRIADALFAAVQRYQSSLTKLRDVTGQN